MNQLLSIIATFYAIKPMHKICFNNAPWKKKLRTNKCLCQRYGSEPSIKEEESRVWIDIEKSRHIDVIRQSGRETEDADHVLRGLNL